MQEYAKIVVQIVKSVTIPLNVQHVLINTTCTNINVLQNVQPALSSIINAVLVVFLLVLLVRTIPILVHAVSMD